MKTETKISNTALKNTKHKYLTTKKKENHDEKRNMETLIQVIISILTAVATTLGVTSCM